MNARHRAIWYAWLRGLLQAFWAGAGTVTVLATADPESYGIYDWPRLKHSLVAMIVSGGFSMRNYLARSPLPDFEEAAEPPKE